MGLRNALRARRERRDRRNDILVLACVSFGDEYYSQIWKRTGLGSGAVYPALARLERADLIRSEWTWVKDLGHRRYRPTADGLDLFRPGGADAVKARIARPQADEAQS